MAKRAERSELDGILNLLSIHKNDTRTDIKSTQSELEHKLENICTNTQSGINQLKSDCLTLKERIGHMETNKANVDDLTFSLNKV